MLWLSSSCGSSKLIKLDLFDIGWMRTASGNAPNFLSFPARFSPDLLECRLPPLSLISSDFFSHSHAGPPKSMKAGSCRARDSELQGLAVAAGCRGWWLLGALRSAGASWPSGGQMWVAPSGDQYHLWSHNDGWLKMMFKSLAPYSHLVKSS